MRLLIGRSQVTGTVGGRRTTQPAGTVDQRTTDTLWRLRRQPTPELLLAAGTALGHAFLAGPVGEALAAELRGTGRHRVGIEVTDPRLAELPWETLVVPGGGTPLLLDDRVDVYRAAPAATPPAPPPVPLRAGPPRILAVFAGPDDSSGQLLDQERELGRLLDAVEPGRHGGGQVRVLEWGSAAAIREALAEEPVDVLHVSCHARPGALLLETAEGAEDPVTAARFRAEVLPPGRVVPLVVLAGCSTARDEDAGQAGLARSLLEQGTPAVLAMNGPVSDDYAIELCTRLYEGLARDPEADLLAVFCAARRAIERGVPRLLPEWATPVLFLAEPEDQAPEPARRDIPSSSRDISSWSRDTLTPRRPAEPDGRSTGPDEGAAGPPVAVQEGVLRRPGDFVGRRPLLRRLSRTAPRAVLHGVGGVGKTSLATELARRFEAAGGLMAAVSGETGVDAILDRLRRRLALHCGSSGLDDLHPAWQAVMALAEPTRHWQEQLEVLRDPGVPLLLVVDNAEDNLDDEHRPADRELAEFLALWARDHALVVTSRYAFDVPGLDAHALGPLSWQETRKLMWRLPGVDALGLPQKREAWNRLGGHPRSLEYLDALLRDGHGRFEDVTARLRAATADRPLPAGGLGELLAGTGALIAEDVLLPQLLDRLAAVPSGLDLLLGASVYRLPVDGDGLASVLSAAPGAEQHPPAPDGMAAALDALLRLGLLAPAGGSQYLVHRWTAGTLAARAGGERLRTLHERAAEYWGRRTMDRPEPARYVEQVIEARYHWLAAGDVRTAVVCTELLRDRLGATGQWSWQEQLLRQTLALVRPDSAVREDALMRAGLVSDLAHVRSSRGDHAQAGTLYREALATFRELGAEADVSVVLHQLGTLAERLDDLDEAERLYREALARKERAGDRHSISLTMHQLAGLHLREGEPARAEQLYLEVLAIAEEVDDQEGIAASCHQIALLALRAKDYAKAEQCALKALSGFAGLGDRINVGKGRVLLSRIRAARFDYEAADTHLRAALDIFEDIGSTTNIAECHLQLGRSARDLHDLGWAETCFARARARYEAVGEQQPLAVANRELGAVRTVLGRAADAVACTAEAWLHWQQERSFTNQVDIDWLAIQYLELGEAAFAAALTAHLPPEPAGYVLEDTAEYVEFSTPVGSPTALGSAYVQLAITLSGAGQYGAARMCLTRALPICQAAGHADAVAKCQEDLGLIALKTKRFAEAERRYRLALDLYERMSNEPNAAIVLHQLGAVYEELADYDRAEASLRGSIALKTRWGNRAGVSNSTFHLGKVAQRRGDHALAERCYLACLSIDEELGERHAIALDLAEIGNLLAEQGRSEEAVHGMVRALHLNEEIGSDNVRRNISALRTQRAKLGDPAFTRLLGGFLDRHGIAHVLTATALLPVTGAAAAPDLQADRPGGDAG